MYMYSPSVLMDRYSKLVALGLLIFFLNLPAAAAPDIFQLPELVEDDVSYIVDTVRVDPYDLPEIEESADLVIPGSSDWPPLKSENPNRRVIIKLEKEPMSVFRQTAHGFVSEKLDNHYHQLHQQTHKDYRYRT